MSTNKSIFKSASVIGSATLVSRLLGFARDVVLAGLFGTQAAFEAFVVAFRIPNMLRELIGEGATNAAFVPVFSEYLAHKEKKEFWQLADKVFKILIFGLGLITVSGIILSPLIVRLIAPGFTRDPAIFALTVKLNRIMFVYLVFIGLTAYGMGILYTFKSFFLPAIGPALLNVALIVSASIAAVKLQQPVFGLAIGVLIGGALQLVIQIPALINKGMRFYKSRPSLDPAVKRIGKLLAPRMLGSAVYQLNVFIDTICASLVSIVGAGAIAAIYYANRIIQLPLAIFGIAISNAALPTMSAYAANKDFIGLKQTINFSLKCIYLVMVPATFGLVILAQPLIKILFQRGQFDIYSSGITSFALVFYALGLVFYSGVKVMLASFYSLQDTLTPVKVASFSLFINTLLNIILMFPLKVGGIALASSIASAVNFFSLFFILRKKIGPLDERGLFFYCLKVSLSGMIMGLCAWFAWKYLFIAHSEILRITITITSGIVVFMMTCFILRIKEISSLVQWILKRK